MELYQEILVHLLENQQIEVNIPALQPGALEHIVESVCYQTLQRIQEVVHDDCLDDTECFQRIEEIVCAFRRLVPMAEVGTTSGDTSRLNIW